LTASYHYEQDDIFFDHLSELRKKVQTVRVTMVVTPENIAQTPGNITRMRHMGVNVNIHPLLTPGWRWDDERWGAIKALDDKPRVFVVDEITQGWEDGPLYGSCHLGDMRYAALGPGGDVYSCYGRLVHHHPIGHIDTWAGIPKVRTCDIRCEFPCDVQARRRIPCA
jgi:hypothetical protein